MLSVLGVGLGTAALFISMAVVSGYESSLRTSVVKVQGHMTIRKRGGISENIESTENQIRDFLPSLAAMTPFVEVEGLMVGKGQLTGVLIGGFSPQTVGLVLDVGSSLTKGKLNLTPGDEAVPPGAVIGKGLASRFNLELGDEFRLVIPVSNSRYSSGFKPKSKKFQVMGVMNLGRLDYDSRLILTNLEAAQSFGEKQEEIDGWRLKLNDEKMAPNLSDKLEEELGYPYWVRSWYDANRNLFQAVRYEKAVIFIVVVLMVIAAAFNVSSTLFLNVVRRYSQISIMKALGVTNGFIMRLFVAHGFLIGILGSLLGVGIGWAGCRLFEWAERTYTLIPGEVYKLDYIKLEIRPTDVILVIGVTMLICLISTLAPARRGAKLLTVEGLRYE
jgi:lipoprotein-releasing system permease protein